MTDYSKTLGSSPLRGSRTLVELDSLSSIRGTAVYLVATAIM